MALFLIVAGVTGSLLAFYQELDALLVPQYHQLPAHERGARMLDPVTLRERAAAARPDMRFDSAWVPWRNDKPFPFYMYAREGEEWGELYLDPYTGAVIGARFDSLSQGAAGVMPFIYRLHYSLALGTIGTWAFGIVALLWTLDCFLGAYLTFPLGMPFFRRWRPAWKLKRQRMNYDLHRAGGLWTWAMLFVLAWSSVAFNLPQLYYPFTKATLGYQEMEQTEVAGKPQPEPPMGWRAGYTRGQELMRTALAENHITAHRDDALHYDASRTEFNYFVATQFYGDGEARDWFGVSFDASTGALRHLHLENLPREKPGNWFTRWIVDLHMARVWGMPFRVFVCAMGLVVTMLSVTGVIIWWRKRRHRL
jgi:uncharacterized iron-regulated membrane protein